MSDLHLQQKGNARQSVSLEQVLLFALSFNIDITVWEIKMTHQLFKLNRQGHRLPEASHMDRFYNAFARQQENQT